MGIGNRAYNILRGYVGREWDRIQGVESSTAEQELLDYSPPPASSPTIATHATPEDRTTHARRLLGVSATASFGEVRKAFERLSERSDPKNFPAGSEEARQAEEIQKRVNWAYQTLTASVDATEKRFRTLEID